VLSRPTTRASAHHDQNRLSGEKFIEHPLNVAGILRTSSSIVTLWPPPSSTTRGGHPPDHRRPGASFGPTVGKLVAASPSWRRSPSIVRNRRRRKTSANARSHAEDVRVVLMKLADRSTTCGRSIPAGGPRRAMPRRRSTSSPAGTPLACGTSSGAGDLSFAQLHPDEYREIVKKIARKRKERETGVNDIKEILERELTGVGISRRPAAAEARLRIASKLAMGRSSRISTTLGDPVLTDSIKDCYGALGVIHSLWKPIPAASRTTSRCRSRTLQSLHTTWSAIARAHGDPNSHP